MTNIIGEVIVFAPAGSVTSPTTGSQSRVSNLVKQLTDRHVSVTVLEYNEYAQADKEATVGDTYRIRGFRKLLPDNLNDINPFLYTALGRTLTNTDPDVIEVEGCAGVLATRIAVRFLDSDVTIVYDAHNVEGVKIKSHEAPSLPFYKRLAAPYVIPLVEKIGVTLADHILAVSEDDKETFVETYDVDPEGITVVPSGVTISPPPSDERKVATRNQYDLDDDALLVVFHGSYTYYPNREAVELICERIAPEITAMCENVQFVLAGKDLPEDGSENVTYIGFVDDLYALLGTADIAIVPLRRGGGTKLKMLDYMNAGLPVVTTETGAEGLPLEHERHALIANGVGEEFIRLLKRLIKDEPKQNELANNIRALAKERFDWNHIGSELIETYESLQEIR